jgi:hypothetical protein
MSLQKVLVKIGGYSIELVDCPTMVCPTCGSEDICPDIPQEIYSTYFQMERKGYNSCRLTMKSDERFHYAEKAQFKYDSRDMSIPGIAVDDDPSHPRGFSCPVYFDRRVLNSFSSDPDYELDFFSESYGEIAKIGTDGWPYEWRIVFGINPNNKVILLLGDLEQIEEDDRAIFWLKSYNIESDHQIVSTELYQAQFNCIFSEPIKEMQIIALRNSFFKKMKKKYGVELFHLESEVEQKGKEIQKPINYSVREVQDNIIILDGVLNEGIDCDQLREVYKRVVNPLPKKVNNLKTRKLLQGIIAKYQGEDEAKKMIAPLFYLNDLRVCFAHVISQEEVDKCKANIVRAFELSDFSEYRKMYDTLIDELYSLYRYLNVTDI